MYKIIVQSYKANPERPARGENKCCISLKTMPQSHETCATLTVIMCDVTGVDLIANLRMVG